MQIFLDVYDTIKRYGDISHPRGKKILELQNFQFALYPYQRFTSFKARKFNLDYLKEEFLWYLRADPKDELITESAQMWTDIRQPDGTFFSNYGVYWFRDPGFKWVIDELNRDKDSRRAVIPMMNLSHLFADNKDVVCTYSISFRIRRDVLSMTVNMRSQDAVWGMTNDVACFSFLHEMVYAVLRNVYPGLEYGHYTHHVDSLHVYERHFDMMDQILEEGMSGFEPVDCPKIESHHEVYYLKNKAKELDPLTTYPFTYWLQDNKYRKARNGQV